jgi:hypothetical protein
VIAQSDLFAGGSVAIWTVTESFQVQLFMNIAAEAQLSSADAGDDGSRSVPRRLLGFVFGYDFFISYSWSDQVFLDRADYALGDDWKKAGAWTLRHTGQLILVGSPAAIRSDPVIHEVKIFSKTRRRIVPIDFAGSLEWTEVRLSSGAISASPDPEDQGTGRRLALWSFGGDRRSHSPNL